VCVRAKILRQACLPACDINLGQINKIKKGERKQSKMKDRPKTVKANENARAAVNFPVAKRRGRNRWWGKGVGAGGTS